MPSVAEHWDEFRAQRPELPPARLVDSYDHQRALRVAREFGHVDAERFAACLTLAANDGKALEVWV